MLSGAGYDVAGDYFSNFTSYLAYAGSGEFVE